MQVTLAPSIQMKFEVERGPFESVSSGITFFLLLQFRQKKKYVLWDAACLTSEEVFKPMTMVVLKPLLFGDGFPLRHTKSLCNFY